MRLPFYERELECWNIYDKIHSNFIMYFMRAHITSSHLLSIHPFIHPTNIFLMTQKYRHQTRKISFLLLYLRSAQLLGRTLFGGTNRAKTNLLCRTKICAKTEVCVRVLLTDFTDSSPGLYGAIFLTFSMGFSWKVRNMWPILIHLRNFISITTDLCIVISHRRSFDILASNLIFHIICRYSRSTSGFATINCTVFTFVLKNRNFVLSEYDVLERHTPYSFEKGALAMFILISTLISAPPDGNIEPLRYLNLFTYSIDWLLIICIAFAFAERKFYFSF